MASFGSFEIEREVYSDAIYTVYSARKPGDPESQYAIKVFSIQRASFEAEIAADLESLLGDIERSRVSAIEVQKKGAAASAFITPVFESGYDERGVWYVTRFYPRSINKIISGRVALTRDALEHLLRSIAQGALDLKRVCGRSHGDIRPSNVQISKSEKLREAEVVLSDPLPGPEEEAARYELGDLRAIGRILLQLVRQRAIENEADFLILPILSSPEWTRLFEKQTDGWLALCNRLLDPNLSLEEVTLEQLMEELERLRYKPPVSRKAVTAGAALVAVCLVAGVIAWFYSKKGNLQITTDPPGAEIKLVDEARSLGKTPLDKTPLAIKRLPKGRYRLRAEYPGLLGQTNTVEIQGGKTLPLHFAFPYGRISITTKPANAEVLLGTNKLGVTPYTSPFLAPTQAAYALVLSNYQPVTLLIRISPDRQQVSIDTNLTELPPGTAVVEFTSQPSGATNFENGVYVCTTPERKTMKIGRHTITTRFEDWPPRTQEITVVQGENPIQDIYLPHGQAQLAVNPPEAEIFLNGKSIGRRVRTKPLPPGDYTVRCENSGYKPSEKRITISDRTTTNVAMSLEAILGFVVFTSDPPGASIFNAKQPERELGRTPFTNSFPPDSYSFIAHYLGLDSVQSKPVEVAMGANIPLNLPFTYGAVRFETEPSGVDMLVAGKKVTTPYVHIQKPGLVPYRVELDDYYLEQGTNNAITSGINRVSLRLRPKVVNVVLRSDPPGAQFMVGGAPEPLRGTNDTFSLPWGTYSITARYSGAPGLPELEPKIESIVVDKKGTTTKKFELQYASLEVTNVEPDARVFYQEKPVSYLPARLILKPEFQHEFVVDDGVDFRTNLPSVKLAAGERRRMGVLFPELRRTYTNSINMVLIRASRDLYVGQFEVTEQEYRLVMGGEAQGKPLQPAVNIKWEDAQAFCNKFSASDKEKELMVKRKLGGWKYSLPTEAQWKLFAEPTASMLEGSLFNRSRLDVPAEIDPNRKSANKLGIYDLFGNAAEWCLGDSNQPITMGGSVFNAKPKLEEALIKLRDQRVPQDAIAHGSPTIGFRCVLQGPSR